MSPLMLSVSRLYPKKTENSIKTASFELNQPILQAKLRNKLVETETICHFASPFQLCWIAARAAALLDAASSQKIAKVTAKVGVLSVFKRL
jgi:hypothetical protein